MQTVIAAATPAACNSGDWQQKFACGWRQPTGTAANLGTTVGHGLGGILIAAVVVLLLIAVTRALASRKPATSSK